MKKSMLVLALAVSGAFAQACPKSSSISGYDDLIRTHGKKNYEDVAKRYQALCAKETKRFTCTSEVVSEVRSEERTKELVGNEKCKDVLKIPDVPGMVKLLVLKTN